MSAFSQQIAAYYDADPAHEWERMDRHRTEFALTRKALEKYLPTPPARLLDCGGGPGRYAIALAGKGYAVTLLDISAGNLRFASQKAKETGVTLEALEQGDGRDLQRFADESFDAVLLMGPLYHILEARGRQQAVQEARRVLKTGGLLFAAFITRYAGIRDAAARNPLLVVEQSKVADQILETGRLAPVGDEEVPFIAYMAHPDEVKPLLRRAELEVLEVIGLEGVTSASGTPVNDLDGADWQRWVEINARISRDPSTHGLTDHLLAVAVKPRWRAVLRQIAGKLNVTGDPYTVVGGAALALHGFDIPVRDIDIETTVEGVYSFQARFPEQVETPVHPSNDKRYRSYFGRFNFDGVPVEVMGDLQRREGENWVPSMAITHTTVDVYGVPVRVAWLEEETVATIRRGKLERAALCLPACDHARLLEILTASPVSPIYRGKA